MKKKFSVDVRVRSEAVSIDRTAKTVAVKNLETGEEYSLPYDTLVLATGSSPVRPPIPGIDSPRVQTLWTVEDAVRIRALVSEAHLKSAVVVGGGFIGLEMAENLRRAGLTVTIVEMLDQVMQFVNGVPVRHMSVSYRVAKPLIYSVVPFRPTAE